MPTNKYGYLSRKSQAISSKAFDFDINIALQNNSNVSQIGASGSRWATFERDRFNLNTDRSNRLFLANEYDEIGVVSVAQSNSTGAFTTPVKLTASVKDDKYVTQNGITFIGLNFIKSLEVYAYRDNTQVALYNLTDADSIQTDLGFEKKQVFLVELQVVNKVEFIVSKIDKPYQFFYVRDFRLEAEEDFKSDTLISVEATNHFSVYGDNIEYSTLDFQIKKDEYDRIFQKNEAISVIKDEGVSKFFTQQSTEARNTYTVNCADFTSLLESEFLGGIYNRKITGKLINDCIGSELSEFYMVSASIFTKELTGYLPICSKREALQQILLATNARKYKLNEVEVFSEFKNELQTLKYDKTNIIGEPQIIRNEPLKKIIVREHNYSKNDEEIEVYNWYAKNGVQVKFSQPLWDLKIYYETLDADGNKNVEEWFDQSSGIERHDNYCVITSISNFKYIIKGKRYTDSIVEYVKENPYTVENQDYLTKTVDLYIHSDSQAVCDLLYELYSRPYSIKFTTLDCPELGGLYDILGHQLNIKSVTEKLDGVYEVEAC